MVDRDIGFEYRQAMELGKGTNPYTRILSGNLLENNKYATLFPLYYYFLLVIGTISNQNFSTFITNYRIVIQLFEYSAFMFLYLRFREKNQKALGLFAASFLLLNRWTILSVSTLKQDIVAITFLLASLYYLDRKLRFSYLLYGVSLGIKHLGIFIMPLYLLSAITRKRRLKDAVLDFMLLFTPVVLPSIPFLIGNFKAFYLSMVFSITRKPVSSCGISPTGYEKLLVNYKNLGNTVAMFFLTLPRLPLIAFTLSNVVLFFTKRISLKAYLMATYIIFAALNPVYFDQYIMWIIPFAMLTLLRDQKVSNTA
jgi:hypothetical protein